MHRHDTYELLTTGEAAREFDLGPEGLRHMHRRGEIEALRTKSGQRLFTRAEVERVKAARAARGAK